MRPVKSWKTEACEYFWEIAHGQSVRLYKTSSSSELPASKPYSYSSCASKNPNFGPGTVPLLASLTVGVHFLFYKLKISETIYPPLFTDLHVGWQTPTAQGCHCGLTPMCFTWRDWSGSGKNSIRALPAGGRAAPSAWGWRGVPSTAAPSISSLPGRCPSLAEHRITPPAGPPPRRRRHLKAAPRRTVGGRATARTWSCPASPLSGHCRHRTQRFYRNRARPYNQPPRTSSRGGRCLRSPVHPRRHLPAAQRRRAAARPRSPRANGSAPRSPSPPRRRPAGLALPRATGGRDWTRRGGGGRGRAAPRRARSGSSAVTCLAPPLTRSRSLAEAAISEAVGTRNRLGNP